MRGGAEERVWLDARRHAVVLAAPFARAAALGAAGSALALLGWPATIGAAVAFAAGAFVALRAAWRWERTRVVLTSERLAVVHGTVRRRSAAVPLARVGAVELEQTLLGRLLGYGTVVAGELEIPYVAEPGRVVSAVGRLAAH